MDSGVYHVFLRGMPRFEHDAVLTCGMLDNLANFPRALLDLACGAYGDGFLAGLDFENSDGAVILTPGILRFRDKFFLLERALNLGEIVDKWRAENSRGINWRICISDVVYERMHDGVVYESLPLYLAPEEAECPGLTIGVFSDQLSPRLPNPYTDDPAGEFNQPIHLNLLQTPWACRGGETFHPYVFRGIIHKLRNKSRKTALDCGLLMELYNHGVASMPSLRLYIENQGGAWPGDNRASIFETLCGCLDYKPKLEAFSVAEPVKAPDKPVSPPPTMLTRG